MRWLVFVLGWVVGCSGLVGDPAGGEADGPGGPGAPGSGPGGGRIEPVVCDTGQPTLPYRDLIRLSKYEYTNALRALLPRRVFDAMAASIALIPDDRIGTEFESHAQGISASHVLGYASFAEAVGKHVERDTDSRDALVPCLAEGETCVSAFIEDFGSRAFRRPLAADEHERYLTLYRTGAAHGAPTGMRLLLSAMLQAPAFLFKIELDGDPVADADDRIHLTDHELAAKLAFYVTGAPPDDELRAAADARELSDAGLMTQLDRLLVDERAVAHFRRFFHQWLVLDQNPDLENIPSYVRDGLHPVALNTAPANEIDALVDFLVWEQQGSFRDLMTTRESFIETGSLAKIYESEDWECCGMSQVTLDERRAGLLTRVAILGDTDGLQHPIIRGKLIREQLLCGHLALPDPAGLPEGALEEPPPDAMATTRDRFESTTSAPECQGCHVQINPLGFALSSYDGLGRYQTHERIYDHEGTLLSELPVNARVDPAIQSPGADSVDGATELGALLAEHPVAIDCFASQWLSYHTAREAEHTDECAVADLASALAHEDDASFISVIRRWVARPEFRTRRIRREEGGSR